MDAELASLKAEINSLKTEFDHKLMCVCLPLYCCILGHLLCNLNELCLRFDNEIVYAAILFLDINRVGQNHTYIRCVYGIFGKEITIHMVIHGVNTWFWPTLHIKHA
jgi:hypothetical protein